MKGVQVSDCAGQCTNWASCLDGAFDPTEKCEKAEKFMILRGDELEDDDTTDWFQIILICVLFVTIIICFFCIAVVMAKARHLREKPHWQINREYFDQHDAKYWDSILPPEKEGDGKYAHMVLNRNGDFIRYKDGYDANGKKKSEAQMLREQQRA